MPSEKIIEHLKKAEKKSRSYTVKKDFFEGGELNELDEKYIVASEIKYLSTFLTGKDIEEKERIYIEKLLNVLESKENLNIFDIERPESLKYIHKLALAEALEDYIKDINKYCRSKRIRFPKELEDIRGQVKRVKATQGKEGEIKESLNKIRDIYSSLSSD